MEIRPLRAGEERMWIQYGIPESEVELRLERFIEQRRNFPEGPLCFIVALENDRCIGKLRGLNIHRGLYVINAIVVACAEAEERIGHALIEYAVKANADRNVEAFNWNRPEDTNFDRILRQNRFDVFIEKVLVRRTLTDFCNSNRDPFSYRTFLEAGRDAFVMALSKIHEVNPNRDAKREDSGTDLDESIDEAGDAFNDEMWKIAFLNGRLAGLLLPQIYPDASHEGTIFNMGLLPEFRSKGWGKILHARGLEELKIFGATEYIGSTDILNAPMVRVFEANGCTSMGVRRIYRRYVGQENDGSAKTL